VHQPIRVIKTRCALPLRRANSNASVIDSTPATVYHALKSIRVPPIRVIKTRSALKSVRAFTSASALRVGLWTAPERVTRLICARPIRVAQTQNAL